MTTNKPGRREHFVNLLLKEIEDVNAKREAERRQTGAWTISRLSLKKLAVLAGKHWTHFYRIREGKEVPSFEVIKNIVLRMPYAEKRRYDLAQALLQAVALDTGRILIEIGDTPESLVRMKHLAHDAALEICEQIKEQAHV